MTFDPAAPNPYESPQDALPADASSWPADARVVFAGRVRRGTLKKALTGRFSWSGMATLLVAALICFALCPPTFFQPFVRVGKIRVDYMGELLAIAGIGFVVLAVWHVVDNCTPWGIRRRERYFLNRVPALYERPLCGWFDDALFYVKEDHCESWLGWAALNHFQANDEVALLEWGSGAGGFTVLTSEMFPSPAHFQRACTMLRRRESPPFDQRQWKQLSDFLMPPDMDALWPSDEQTIAECSRTISYHDGMLATLKTIPLSVWQGSGPLHGFFGLLVFSSLLFAEHQPHATLVLVALWGGILMLATLMAAANIRHFFRHGSRRLLASKIRFTDQEVHIAATVGYFRAPLDEFVVTRCDREQIVLVQKGHHEMATRLTPDLFADQAQWQSLWQRLQDMSH